MATKNDPGPSHLHVKGEDASRGMRRALGASGASGQAEPEQSFDGTQPTRRTVRGRPAGAGAMGTTRPRQGSPPKSGRSGRDSVGVPPRRGLVAQAEVTVDAPPAKVWKILTDPEAIQQYMFGANVTTDWEEGSPITWSGEFEGKAYEDKGMILECKPGKRLRVTHYSPLSGKPDTQENYHVVTYTLEPAGPATRLTLQQDGNHSEEEAAHSTKNWQMMLEKCKTLAEGNQDE